MSDFAELSAQSRIGSPEEEPVSAADRVCFEVVRALEQGRLVPGQRIVETELAVRLGVGRNAVREAIQRLAAKGIVDVSRNRSPAIRTVDLEETLQVLEVAAEMFALLARTAARNYRAAAHGPRLRAVLAQLLEIRTARDRATFSVSRRAFYKALLEVSGNRELQRQFTGLQMQIIYAQYQSEQLQEARMVDYHGICTCVMEGNIRRAEAMAREHVRHVGRIIRALAAVAGPI